MIDVSDRWMVKVEGALWYPKRAKLERLIGLLERLKVTVLIGLSLSYVIGFNTLQ